MALMAGKQAVMLMAVQVVVMTVNTIPTTPATLMVSTTMINATITTTVMITNVQAHWFGFKSPKALFSTSLIPIG